MTYRNPLLLGAALLATTACGSEPATATPRASASSGASTSASAAEPPPPMPVAELQRGADWVPHLPALDNPSLTVRVEGPAAIAEVDAGAAPFETRVLVTNTGDEAAEVETARVRFDVWAADGDRDPCALQGDPGPAPLLEPGEAHELRVIAVCPFPEPGDYEVRTYVSFAAEAVDTSLEIERYYAGRAEVAVD